MEQLQPWAGWLRWLTSMTNPCTAALCRPGWSTTSWVNKSTSAMKFGKRAWDPSRTPGAAPFSMARNSLSKVGSEVQPCLAPTWLAEEGAHSRHPSDHPPHAVKRPRRLTHRFESPAEVPACSRHWIQYVANWGCAAFCKETFTVRQGAQGAQGSVWRHPPTQVLRPWDHQLATSLIEAPAGAFSLCLSCAVAVLFSSCSQVDPWDLGVWTRWSSKVPSHPSHCLILCLMVYYLHLLLLLAGLPGWTLIMGHFLPCLGLLADLVAST